MNFQDKLKKKKSEIKKAEEEKMFASMTEFEVKIYKLEKEENKEVFIKESAEILKEIDTYENEDDKILIAKVLKRRFEEFGLWEVKKKKKKSLKNKQKEKVDKIKQILNNNK